MTKKRGICDQRDRENSEENDFTPTPRGALIPLLENEEFSGDILEPACGQGHISRVLIEYGYKVTSTDLIDRGYGIPRQDFLLPGIDRVENIITNPPFKLATQFMRRALELTTRKVALFLPLNYMSGDKVCGRREIWENTPIRTFYVFSNRVKMKRGGDGAGKGGGGVINFMWAVWEHGFTGDPTVKWVRA